MSVAPITVAKNAERLIEKLRGLQSVAIAFSGGVDSSVVAAAAVQSGLAHVVAVTARSPSLSGCQLDIAKEVATEIGIEHRIIETDEINRDAYRRNDGQRCFFCKQTLYHAMESIVKKFPNMQIVSGTNADDLGDYRPGLRAADEAGVRAPLAELSLTKSDVRELARHFGLSNRELPAAPCLASRIAYGTEVTAQRLRRIEQAEDWLRVRGFVDFRVRLHEGELARIEVMPERMADLLDADRDQSLTNAFVSYGFKFVTIDTRGFRSGSLNEMLVNISTLPERAHSNDELKN